MVLLVKGVNSVKDNRLVTITTCVVVAKIPTAVKRVSSRVSLCAFEST